MVNRVIPSYETYYCRDCGDLIEPLFVELDGGAWELKCTSCGSDNLKVAKHCEICGEAYGETPDKTDNVFGVCEGCLENIDYSIRQAIATLQDSTELTGKEAKAYVCMRAGELYDAM